MKDEHRTGAVTDYLVGDAAEQHPAQAAAPVCRDSPWRGRGTGASAPECYRRRGERGSDLEALLRGAGQKKPKRRQSPQSKTPPRRHRYGAAVLMNTSTIWPTRILRLCTSGFCASRA